MKKFLRGFGKSDYIDENAVRVRKEQLAKLKELIRLGGHEAEAEYVQSLKEWRPEISKEELLEAIRLYHDAVSERQSRDRESR